MSRIHAFYGSDYVQEWRNVYGCSDVGLSLTRKMCCKSAGIYKIYNLCYNMVVNRTLKLLRNSRKHQLALGILMVAILAPLIYIFAGNLISSYWEKAESYSVNPAIFVGLLLITFVPYYWSWSVVLRKAMKRQWLGFFEVVIVNRLIWALPWVYVYVVGENYPWWVRPAIIIWGGLALILAIVRAIRTSQSKRKDNTDEQSVGGSGLAV